MQRTLYQLGQAFTYHEFCYVYEVVDYRPQTHEPREGLFDDVKQMRTEQAELRCHRVCLQNKNGK